MTTLTILLIFFGSFAFYNTSKKAELQQKSSVEKSLQNNTKQAKIIGLILVAIALIIAIKKFDITSGILFWLVTLMTVISLIIVLYPLRKFNYKYVLILFVILFFIEILTTNT